MCSGATVYKVSVTSERSHSLWDNRGLISQRRWGQVKHGGKKTNKKSIRRAGRRIFFWQVDNLDSLNVCDVCEELHLACGVCHITGPDLYLLPLSSVSSGTDLH